MAWLSEMGVLLGEKGEKRIKGRWREVSVKW